MKRKLMVLFRAIYMHFFYILRNRHNRNVFFSSFAGGGYGDSQKAISEALYIRDPTVNQIWETKGNLVFPSYVKTVKGHLKVKKAMAQSRVWVTDQSYEWKKDGIYSIAVWHGDRSFKKILHKFLKYDYIIGDTIDLFIAGSRFGEEVARDSFLFNGEVLNIGMPRNDKLVNHSEMKDECIKIKKSLGILDDVKLLIYAPTFRDGLKSGQNVTVDLTKVLDILESKGQKWQCLLRSHHCSAGLIYAVDSRFVNVSQYGDMTDLLLVSDFLITDYSSCIHDFILMERPCLLAHFDRHEYNRNSREFRVEPKDTGFLIANSQEEMNEIIKNIDNYDFKKIASDVNKFYGTNETGKSTGVIVERIIDVLD